MHRVLSSAAATLVLAGCALACASSAVAGGGGGTYLAFGDDYDFTLVNAGATAWRAFYLVAPSAVTFVGGTTGNEGSATCVVGQPDGTSNEIECGQLATNILPPQGRVAFVATTSAKSVCSATFSLFVSNDGSTFSHVADLTEAPGCGVQSVTLVAAPTLHGRPVVGGTIRATAPVWSAAPTKLRYGWERCAGASCTTIAGVTGLRLVLTKRDAGHTVRLVATATIGGHEVRATSRALAVRARRR